jgi:hypothetical protein
MKVFLKDFPLPFRLTLQSTEGTSAKVPHQEAPPRTRAFY